MKPTFKELLILRANHTIDVIKLNLNYFCRENELHVASPYALNGRVLVYIISPLTLD